MVILFSFDNYYGITPNLFFCCWPVYLHSGVPQILAVSPGHGFIVHLPPRAPQAPSLLLKPGHSKPTYL